MRINRRTAAALFSATLLTSALAACGDSSDDSSSSASGSGAAASGDSASQGAWPRTIKHKSGTVTLKEQPKNIVSTSVVLTGSLLAIGAPVKGSGASMPGGVGFDKNGYFTQWSKQAEEKGVKPLYTKSKLDLEAVRAAKPDLIVVSDIGGDSAKDQYGQLKQIAPTVVVDYNSTPWEEVTTELGKITGHEAGAKKALTNYSAQLKKLKTTMTPPSKPVQAIVFQGDQGAAFAVPGGPHDDVLKKLGVKLAPLPEGAKAEKGRGDISFLSTEAAVAGLTASDVLLIDGDDKTVKQMKSTPAYKNVPAQKGIIAPLGHPSFKLDYYAALDMAQHVAKAYKKK